MGLCRACVVIPIFRERSPLPQADDPNGIFGRYGASRESSRVVPLFYFLADCKMIQIWVYQTVGFPLRKASPRGEAPAKRVMRWCTWVNFHYRAKEKRRCGGYTSSVGCAATFPSRGRLTRRPNSPLNPNLKDGWIATPQFPSIIQLLNTQQKRMTRS